MTWGGEWGYVPRKYTVYNEMSGMLTQTIRKKMPLKTHPIISKRACCFNNFDVQTNRLSSDRCSGKSHGEVGPSQDGLSGAWAKVEEANMFGPRKDDGGSTSPVTLIQGNRMAKMACLGWGPASVGAKMACLGCQKMIGGQLLLFFFDRVRKQRIHRRRRPGSTTGCRPGPKSV